MDDIQIILEKYANNLTTPDQAKKQVLDLFDVSKCAVYRICEHCNKEYECQLSYTADKKTGVNNFQDCPNCGERDDAWVKVVIKHIC